MLKNDKPTFLPLFCGLCSSFLRGIQVPPPFQAALSCIHWFLQKLSSHFHDCEKSETKPISVSESPQKLFCHKQGKPHVDEQIRLLAVKEDTHMIFVRRSCLCFDIRKVISLLLAYGSSFLLGGLTIGGRRKAPSGLHSGGRARTDPFANGDDI